MDFLVFLQTLLLVYTSDLLVGLGGSVILSEFPELCGVEQELSDRCVEEDSPTGSRHLMKTYNERAKAVGSGFDMNPSPGNIKDGLITDAIKSAGAAKKGGTSPVVARCWTIRKKFQSLV
jgi:altronate hydrolase